MITFHGYGLLRLGTDNMSHDRRVVRVVICRVFSSDDLGEPARLYIENVFFVLGAVNGNLGDDALRLPVVGFLYAEQLLITAFLRLGVFKLGFPLLFHVYIYIN